MVVNVAVRNVKYIGTLNYILYKSRLSCCLCERCHTKEVDISVITVNTPSAMDPVSYLPACLCGFLSFNRSSTIDLWACQAWPEIPRLERTVVCLTFGDWDDQMTELSTSKVTYKELYGHHYSCYVFENVNHSWNLKCLIFEVIGRSAIDYRDK